MSTPSGVSSGVPGLRVYREEDAGVRSPQSDSGSHVTSLEQHGGLGPPGSLSSPPAPARLLAPPVPPPGPHLCFSLALLGTLLSPSRWNPCQDQTLGLEIKLSSPHSMPASLCCYPPNPRSVQPLPGCLQGQETAVSWAVPMMLWAQRPGQGGDRITVEQMPETHTFVPSYWFHPRGGLSQACQPGVGLLSLQTRRRGF